MAHFITLFFMSIGLNFGTPQTQDFKPVQNVKQIDTFKFKKFNSNNNRTKLGKKLYSDNKNVVRINPIGMGGWEDGQ